jgi:hypothetical protein
MEITLLKIMTFDSNQWKSQDVIENGNTRVMYQYVNKITNEILPANDFYRLCTRKQNYYYDKKLLISANIPLEKIDEFLLQKYYSVDSNKIDTLSFH